MGRNGDSARQDAERGPKLVPGSLMIHRCRSIGMFVMRSLIAELNRSRETERYFLLVMSQN
jgi:hypothetical protein